MVSPVNRLIDSSVSCSKCGTKGMFNCDCFYKCWCGWIIDKGEDCRNPKCKVRKLSERRAASKEE